MDTAYQWLYDDSSLRAIDSFARIFHVLLNAQNF
jgi:hypothetical protein